MEVVGLVGYAQSGKDSVANILVEQGWRGLALATPLKHALYNLNPLISVRMGSNVRVADLVDEVGWDEAKQVPEVRLLLQRMGTEVGRQVFWNDFWVDLASQKIEGHKAGLAQGVVITDVRFPNEVRMIRRFGGSIVQVKRPGIEALNGHASEVELKHEDVADFTIHNDGTLDDLRETVAFYFGYVLS